MDKLSTTAFAAIWAGVGVVFLALLAGLIFAVIRARRTHKRLLADLDERRHDIARAQAQDSKTHLITKPRGVQYENGMGHIALSRDHQSSGPALAACALCASYASYAYRKSEQVH
jgi:heme exporter protein D